MTHRYTDKDNNMIKTEPEKEAVMEVERYCEISVISTASVKLAQQVVTPSLWLVHESGTDYTHDVQGGRDNGKVLLLITYNILHHLLCD